MVGILEIEILPITSDDHDHASFVSTMDVAEPLVSLKIKKMSRSKKKVKKRAITTATTEKEDKQFANRRFRRKNKAKTKAVEEDNYPLLKEVSDVWGFAKDGKIYDKEMTEKDMRK